MNCWKTWNLELEYCLIPSELNGSFIFRSSSISTTFSFIRHYLLTKLLQEKDFLAASGLPLLSLQPSSLGICTDHYMFVFAFDEDYRAHIRNFLFVSEVLRSFGPLCCPSTQEIQVEYLPSDTVLN